MQLRVADMTITRRRHADVSPEAVAEREDGVRIVSHLTDFGHYSLWKSGELAFEGRQPNGLMDITNLGEEWKYHHLAPFDLLEFKFPLSFIQSAASQAGRPEFRGLQTALGAADPVIVGLSKALMPFFDDRGGQQASPLFLESITSALLIHLMQTYGGIHFPPRDKGTLAPWQERRSLEFLADRLDARLSLADLAAECDVSVSYLNKTFKKTFGTTPHKWLREYRISRVKDLLAGTSTLTDIAAACGFSDQSHMTRVFTDVVGEPPASWRQRRHSRA